MSSGLINIASIDREVDRAALDARAHVPDDELFFQGERAGLQT